MTTPAPWTGTLKLSAKQRKALHVDPVVTDALIDDVLPSVEYIAYCRRFGAGVTSTETRRQWVAKAHAQAIAVAQFRALLQEETLFGYTFFCGRWIDRGVPREVAQRLFKELQTDLADLERYLLAHASNVKPRPGVKPNWLVDELVRAAAAYWREHTDRATAVVETSPFVRFCAALGALAGMDLTPDKIERALVRGN